MVKIVNGVVVKEDNGTEGFADSGSTGSEGVNILGFQLSGWMILGLLFLSLVLNGPRGLAFCGTALGVAYVFTNWSSLSAGTSSSSTATSSMLSNRTPGNPNVRTVKDLPKTPAKSC